VQRNGPAALCLVATSRPVRPGNGHLEGVPESSMNDLGSETSDRPGRNAASGGHGLRRIASIEIMPRHQLENREQRADRDGDELCASAAQARERLTLARWCVIVHGKPGFAVKALSPGM
jgi:hypothetical protein